MKKEQKIIELRTAAKRKVAELVTKIAFANSYAASNRASLMRERADEINGLEAGSTERFDALAKYRAKLAGVNEQLAATVAQLKYEIQNTWSECNLQCAAAEDDPEPAKEQQPTAKDDSVATSIHYDGTQTSLIRTIVAIFNDSPAVPAGCSFDVSVFRHSHKALGLDDETSVHLSAYNGKKQEGGRTLTLDISETDSPEEQMKKYTEWRAALDFHFSQGKEEDNE